MYNWRPRSGDNLGQGEDKLLLLEITHWGQIRDSLEEQTVLSFLASVEIAESCALWRMHLYHEADWVFLSQHTQIFTDAGCRGLT